MSKRTFYECDGCGILLKKEPGMGRTKNVKLPVYTVTVELKWDQHFCKECKALYLVPTLEDLLADIENGKL